MYTSLGIAISLALLLILYLLASLLVAAWWRKFARRGGLLFALRMFPAAFSIGVVLFVAIPAYLALEPLETGERIGWKLGTVASLAILAVAVAIGRAVHGWMSSRRLALEWMRAAQPLKLDGVDMESYRVEHPFPLLAIAGIFRPRLFVANRLLESMPSPQMSAALAHEAGHLAAHDNLRRLLLLLFPGPRRIDRAWLASSEIAADTYAARQGNGVAVELASALIHVARLFPRDAGRVDAFPPCMQMLAADSATGLAERVTRLLEMSELPDASAAEPWWANPWWANPWSSIAVFGAAGLLVYWTSPAGLHAAHEALEVFVRLLS